MENFIDNFKVWGVNLPILGFVGIADIESILSIILLCLSIYYTIISIIKKSKERKK
jgi:hypothetical protein